MERAKPGWGTGAAALLVLLHLAVPAWGETSSYIDKKYGFEIRILKDWTQTPTQPDELLEVAKFKDDRDRDFATLGIFRFAEDSEAAEYGLSESAQEYLESFMVDVYEFFGQTFEKLPKPKTVKIDGQSGRIYTWEFEHPEYASASEYPMAGIVAKDREEYLLLYRCPKNQASRRRTGEFASSIRSFKFGPGTAPTPEKADPAEEAAAADLLDPEKRKRVKKELVEGWRFIDTPHYIVIFDCDQKLADFVAEEIEWMRVNAYQKVFELAEPIREAMVVRICKEMDEYRHYGAPPGSAGYWSGYHDEFVFPDLTKQSKEITLGVLRHEGFHQYIHYALAKHDPPTWFNEGFAEYFFCARRGGKDKLEFEKRHSMRYGTVKNALGRGELIPTVEFVRLSHEQYMARADLCYAQGWAFAKWLKSVTSNERYREIPDIYFREMQAGFLALAKKAAEAEFPIEYESPAAARRVERDALEKAFEGVDPDKLHQDFLSDLKKRM